MSKWSAREVESLVDGQFRAAHRQEASDIAALVDQRDAAIEANKVLSRQVGALRVRCAELQNEVHDLRSKRKRKRR